MTTASEDGTKLYGVCVDAKSGKVLHDQQVLAIEHPQFCHSMNSYATPTPVIEDGRVYLHFGSAGTVCLDTKTARTIWARQDLPCNHFRGAASSPILTGNLLVINFDGFDLQYVVGLDKKTGKTVWKKDREIDYGSDDGDGKKAYGTPRVIEAAGRAQLVSPSAGATVAYDPGTGGELWRVRSGGMNASARPLFGHGLVYATTAAGGFQLFAVRPDGKGDVTGSHVAWKFAKSVPSRSSPLLVDDLIFMIADQGVASCVEARSGQSVWQKRIEGAFSASPVYADGRIYFFSEDGQTPVIEPAREFKQLALNKLDAGFMASPAITGKAFILRTKTHLYRIEE